MYGSAKLNNALILLFEIFVKLLFPVTAQEIKFSMKDFMENVSKSAGKYGYLVILTEEMFCAVSSLNEV